MVSITSDDILGKEAVDPDGTVLGIVMKLHIDKQEKKLLGMTVDQGFMKPDLFIGMQHIKHFGVDAVFLSTAPADKLKGLEVLTADGKHIGRVKDVKLKGKKVEAITVAHGFSKEKEINSSDVQEMGARIILK
jgi:sporulation protein YlmC with PRC-barrel domain